jgi:hypothetical protein
LIPRRIWKNGTLQPSTVARAHGMARHRSRSRGSGQSTRMTPPSFSRRSFRFLGEFTRSWRVCQRCRSFGHKSEGSSRHDHFSCAILFIKALQWPARLPRCERVSVVHSGLRFRESLVSSWPLPAELKPIHGTLKKALDHRPRKAGIGRRSMASSTEWMPESPRRLFFHASSHSRRLASMHVINRIADAREIRNLAKRTQFSSRRHRRNSESGETNPIFESLAPAKLGIWRNEPNFRVAGTRENRNLAKRTQFSNRRHLRDSKYGKTNPIL